MLKISDNPFSKYNETEYKQYAIAYLKDLKYLDYELIDEELRDKAKEKYKDDIQDKEIQNNAEKQDEQSHQVDPELKDAKIDCTDEMLAKIMKEDDDAQKLESLPKFPEFF